VRTADETAKRPRKTPNPVSKTIGILGIMLIVAGIGGTALADLASVAHAVVFGIVACLLVAVELLQADRIVKVWRKRP
jgi:hypothetical protein